jgi:hypothetical protein
MTKLSIISALLLLSSGALAQDSGANLAPVSFSTASGTSYVDDADVPRRGRLVEHHGFYAAPTFGVTNLDHEVAPTVGMRSAWLANHTFGLGFALNAVANQLDEKANHKGRALGVYGGLLLQYVIGHGHRVHGSVDTTVGGGVMCQQTGSSGKDDCVGRRFFALEPMANLEIDVFSAMRVSVGAGYRLAIAGSDSTLSDAALRGFVSRAALEFGKF